MSIGKPYRGGIGVAAVLSSCALLAAACGSSSSSSSKSSLGAEQGVTSSTITIGSSQPMTGGAATAGIAFAAGVKKAVDAVNKAGGIDGRQVKLVMLDNQFTAPETLANFRELIQQDKVYAIVVPAGTATIPSAWPLVQQSGIPVFGPYEPTDPNLPSVFELVSGQKEQAMVETKYLAQKGMTKIAYIGTDDANGQENLAGLKEEAPKVNATVVYSDQVPTGSDVSSEILAAKQAGAQAILVGTNNTQSDLVIKATAALNWHPVIIGNASAMGTGGSTTVKPVGSLANGVIGALTTALPTASAPGVADWKAQGALSAAANYDLIAYSTTQAFFSILKQAGQNLSWKNFDKTAESLKDFSTGGVFSPLTFGPLPGGHTGSSGAALAQYNNGTWTQITDFIQP